MNDGSVSATDVNKPISRLFKAKFPRPEGLCWLANVLHSFKSKILCEAETAPEGSASDEGHQHQNTG